jgi:rhodanese-related sulfurtransferase
MKNKKHLLTLLLLPVICFALYSAMRKADTQYKCLPCGLACDETQHEGPGECEKCHMELVPASTITFKTLEPETICEYVKSHPKAILLDVRTAEEFEGKADPDFGTLKNAINIPLQELEARVAELKKYKNSDIVVYCSHSHRSPQAAYILTQNGFKHVTNMSGGMSTLTDNNCKK